MAIYHYTSIQTLALILKNKKIRFNRLDRVDDMEESIYGSGPFGTKLAQYTFVSCWTKSAVENIALWNMYTQFKGVRIGLDEIPFVTNKINDYFYSFFPSKFELEDDFIYSCINNEAKLYDVEYVDNLEEMVRELVQTDGTNSFQIHTPNIGLYKRKEWAMQQESRFRIQVMPIDLIQAFQQLKLNGTITPVDILQSNNGVKTDGKVLIDVISTLFNSIGASLVQNKPIKKTYIDIDLDPEKLNNIEVMMGPLTSKADKIIVESLLNPFTGSTIKNSTFYGKLREK